MLLTSFLSFPTWAADNINIAQWAAGTLQYTKGEDSTVLGREIWRLNIHPDKSRTLEVQQQADGSGAYRTAVVRVDAQSRPVESYQAYWYQGALMGSGLFTIGATSVEAVLNTPTGRQSHTLDIPEHISLVPHPIAAGGLHFWYYDKAKGGEQDGMVYALATATREPGTLLGKVNRVKITRIGDERLTTAAGTFAVGHYEMSGGLSFWILENDGIVVKSTEARSGNVYTLVKLERGS